MVTKINPSAEISNLIDPDDIDETIINKDGLLLSLSEKGFLFCRKNYQNALPENTWNEILPKIVEQKISKMIDDLKLEKTFKEEKPKILENFTKSWSDYILEKSSFMTPQKSDKLRVFFTNDQDISYFFLKKKEIVSMVHVPQNEKKVVLSFLSEESKNNNQDISVDFQIVTRMEKFLESFEERVTIYARSEDDWRNPKNIKELLLNGVQEMEKHLKPGLNIQFWEYLFNVETVKFEEIYAAFLIKIVVLSFGEEEIMTRERKEPYDLLFLSNVDDSYIFSKYQFFLSDIRNEALKFFQEINDIMIVNQRKNLIYMHMVCDKLFEKLIETVNACLDLNEAKNLDKDLKEVLVEVLEYLKKIFLALIIKDFYKLLQNYRKNLTLRKELIFGCDCESFSYNFLRKKKNEMLRRFHPDKLNLSEAAELAYEINILFDGFEKANHDNQHELLETKGDNFKYLSTVYKNSSELKQYNLFHAKQCYYDACLIADRKKILAKQVTLRRKLAEVTLAMEKNFEFRYYLFFGMFLVGKWEKRQNPSPDEQKVLLNEKRTYQEMVNRIIEKLKVSTETSVIVYQESNQINCYLCKKELLEISNLVSLNEENDLVLREVTPKRMEDLLSLQANCNFGIKAAVAGIAGASLGLGIGGFQISMAAAGGVGLKAGMVATFGGVLGPIVLGIGLVASIGVGIWLIKRNYDSYQRHKELEAIMNDFNERLSKSFDMIKQGMFHEFLELFSKEFKYELPKTKSKRLFEYDRSESKSKFLKISYKEFGENLLEIGLRPDVILYLLLQIFEALTNLDLSAIKDKQVTSSDIHNIAIEILEVIRAPSKPDTLNGLLDAKAEEFDSIIKNKDNAKVSESLSFKEKLYCKWYGIPPEHIKSSKRMLIKNRLENHRVLSYFNYSILRIFLNLEEFIESLDSQNILYGTIKKCITYYKSITKYEFFCEFIMDSKIELMRNLVYAFSDNARIEEFENLLKKSSTNNENANISEKEQILRLLSAIDYGDCKINNLPIENNEKFFILSINGGGLRGIIPLVFLSEIEKRSKRFIARSFNLIGGPSIGSIISGGLVISVIDSDGTKRPKFLASQLLHQLLFKNDRIFRKKFFKLSSKYDSKSLEELLIEFFGDAKMEEAITHLMIPTCVRDKTRFFTNKNSKHMIRKLTLASSSAPTYFPPQVIDGEEMVDAGVTTNNLTLDLYNYAVNDLKIDPKNIVVVSLGTGIMNGTLPQGLFGWATNGLNYAINAQVCLLWILMFFYI